jgi:hypothetical protein
MNPPVSSLLPNSDRGVWKQICYRADAYLVKMPNPIELVL